MNELEGAMTDKQTLCHQLLDTVAALCERIVGIPSSPQYETMAALSLFRKTSNRT